MANGNSILSSLRNSLQASSDTQAMVAQPPARPLPPVQQSSQTVQSQALDILDEVVTQVLDNRDQDVDVISQAWPQVVDQATDTLNVPGLGSAQRKEAATVSQVQVVETAQAAQQVEIEPVREQELQPEISAFVQKVEEHSQGVQHIAVDQAGQVQLQPDPGQVARPVIILPISDEEDRIGSKASPLKSIRWLVEWSHKVMKMFSGQVVYSDT